MPAEMMARAGVRDVESEVEIAAFLTGAPRSPRAPASFAHAAIQHGVAPLLVKAGVSAWLPTETASVLVTEARRQAVLCAVRDRQLAGALDALDRGGVPALVMKGSALAHTVYPEPHLRPRQDSDLLIRAADRARAVSALGTAGYLPEPEATNQDALGQMLLDLPGSPAATLDVHWRASAAVSAAAWFDLDAILARSVGVPPLGRSARGPGTSDALALACVHLAAHHRGQERLLWWYDIHLLLGALDAEGSSAFVRTAASAGMARVCLDGIEAAARLFPSAASAAMLARLRPVATTEPAAPLLGRRRKVDDLRQDLASLGWRGGLSLVRAHLFPPAAYMRRTYAPHSRAPLAWLYVRRIARGARAWHR